MFLFNFYLLCSNNWYMWWRVPLLSTRHVLKIEHAAQKANPKIDNAINSNDWEDANSDSL